MKHPNSFFAFIISVCFLLYGCTAQSQPNFLKLIASIKLPDVSGRIDHLAYDSTHNIVYVAANAASRFAVNDNKPMGCIIEIV